MRRLGAATVALCLAALACGDTTSDPQETPPPAGIAGGRFPDTASGSEDCAGYQVSWANPTDSDVASLLVTDPEGDEVVARTAEDAFERLLPLWCTDLTGDGAAELLYESFSGGAHCCTHVEVLSLVDPETTLLSAGLGNAGPPEPRQLDDDDALELVGYSDVFAYFELSFAASPFIPLVYAFDGALFAVATAVYPEVVDADIEQHLERAGELRAEGAPADALHGLALGIYGNHLILGDPAGGIERVRESVPEAVEWLEAIADDAAEHFEAAYGEGFEADERELPA